MKHATSLSIALAALLAACSPGAEPPIASAPPLAAVPGASVNAPPVSVRGQGITLTARIYVPAATVE